MQVINLMEVMGDAAKEEEVKEGMEHDHDHGDEGHDEHDDHDEHDHDHDHEDGEIEYDEHVWLSVKNAKLLCTEIADKLTVLDSANAADYQANLNTYTAQLDKLDGDFQALAESASQKTLVFGDRFPFRYLTDDYGITYYAAFVGCSAESEASFETVAFLSGKVDELGLRSVMRIETSDGAVARAVVESTKTKDQQILTMNSLQSVTGAGGETYLSVMEENLEVLKAALN